MTFQNYSELRFCKVHTQQKAPFETDWPNKPYSWQDIQSHITLETNYGVLCGHGGLIVIDADEPLLQAVVERELPETFKVKTGRGGTHNYFFCPEVKKKILLETTKHFGEVQSFGTQIIGPGSIHPNGNQYVPLNDKEIQTITKEQLLLCIKPFIKEVKTEEEQSLKEISFFKEFGKEDINSVSITSVINTSGFKRAGNGELYGPNPWHGSDTGMNFWINSLKNVAHCFRCNCGINVAQAIALNEGIISSCDKRLDRQEFIEVLKLARTKYGLGKEVVKVQESSVIEPESNELKLWQYKDFEKLQKEKNFFIKDFLKPSQLLMLISRPGESKSITTLYASLCIATGKPFLGVTTKKHAVLYCDKENSDQIIKERLAMLRKGLNIQSKTFPLFFLRREGDILDKTFIQKLSSAIDKNKIKVVVFDTLHRFGNFDENSANDMNNIYLNFFLPLLEKKIAIIFLHHTTKKGEFRGSGDFLGCVTSAYKIFQPSRAKKEFVMVYDKLREGGIEELRYKINRYEDYTTFESQSIEEEKVVSKKVFVELIHKVEALFTDETIRLKRKEIEERLQIQEYEFSIATFKRVLKFLLENKTLDQDEQGFYFKIK